MRASICIDIRITESRFRYCRRRLQIPFGNPSGPHGQKASDATVTTINPLRSEFDGERRGDRSIGREIARAVRRRENDDGDGGCFVSRQALTVRLFGRDKSTTVDAGPTANSALQFQRRWMPKTTTTKLNTTSRIVYNVVASQTPAHRHSKSYSSSDAPKRMFSSYGTLAPDEIN